MKILDLVLKHKWYDMIDRGEKKEEYREIKPYWEKRLLDYKRLSEYVEKHYMELRIKRVFFPHRAAIENVCKSFPRGYTHVRFHRGYTSTTMIFTVSDIDMGTGNPEWGAPTDRPVFIIKLGKKIGNSSKYFKNNKDIKSWDE